MSWRRTPARALVPVLLAGAALACASSASRAPSGLAVEVMEGFAAPPSLAPVLGERVELLLDATRSMRRPTRSGARRIAAARRAATRLLRGLPSEASVGLHALGTSKEACGAVAALARSEADRPRDALLSKIDAIRPGGEGSLAEALEQIAADLALGGGGVGSRVAVLSDFDDECGGDLCAALASVVSAGARVDLVALGDTSPPDCATAPLAVRPRSAPGVPSEPMRFWVESYDPDAASGSARVAEGRADGEPRVVPPGPAVVVVDFEPPERIGPLLISPATLTRVRVLDFPALDPPVREWSWDSLPWDPPGGATDGEAPQ